jgi:hypothetical protein
MTSSVGVMSTKLELGATGVGVGSVSPVMEGIISGVPKMQRPMSNADPASRKILVRVVMRDSFGGTNVDI